MAGWEGLRPAQTRWWWGATHQQFAGSGGLYRLRRRGGVRGVVTPACGVGTQHSWQVYCRMESGGELVMAVAASGMLWRPREEQRESRVSLLAPDELFFIQLCCLLASVLRALARYTAALALRPLPQLTGCSRVVSFWP